MKTFAYVILTFISSASIAQLSNQINWMTWDEMTAIRETDSVKKKIFIDFYTGWCGWCKKMDATTFSDPNIVTYMNQNFYAVKFDAETKDTIVFNNHTFINTDPTFVKKSTNARGRAHWFAQSLLESQLSYPSYAMLDENFTRLMIWKGYKKQDELIGILVFFATNQYKYYHNFLNEQWRKSLQQQQGKTQLRQ